MYLCSLDQLLDTLENTTNEYNVANVAKLFTPIVKCLTFIYIIVLSTTSPKCGLNSQVLFRFWLFLSIGTAFVISLPKQWPTLDSLGEIKKCPKTDSSFVSRLTFSWFTPMIMNGYRKPLTTEDMWPLEAHNMANNCVQQFNKHWRPVTENKIKAPVNILPPILRTYGPSLALNSMLKLLATLLTLSQPVILDRLITFLTTSDQSTAESDCIGYTYALLLFVCPVLASVLDAQHDYWSNVIGMRMRTSITSILYEKAVKLSSNGRKDITAGDLVNLVSTDMKFIVFFLSLYHTLWVSPLKLFVSIGLLWAQLGAASLAGVILMVILVPINTFHTSISNRMWAELQKRAAGRVSAITEILNHIKVLKLYAWEQCFIDKVSALRASEVDMLDQAIKSSIWTSFMFNSSGILVSLLSFTTFTLISDHNILDANKAFVSLSLFTIMGGQFQQLPRALSSGQKVLIIFNKMNAYLNANEVNESFVDHKHNQRTPIIVKNGSFKWDNNCNDSVLKNINIEIERQSLVAVVGRVGAG
ncbi:unnamed protein product, partial [Medioppia subpectinata]